MIKYQNHRINIIHSTTGIIITIVLNYIKINKHNLDSNQLKLNIMGVIMATLLKY